MITHHQDPSDGEIRLGEYPLRTRKNMKAISLWQPWASAMARGDKRNGNPVMGNQVTVAILLICSAKRRPTREMETGSENFDAAILALPYGFALMRC